MVDQESESSPFSENKTDTLSILASVLDLFAKVEVEQGDVDALRAVLNPERALSFDGANEDKKINYTRIYKMRGDDLNRAVIEIAKLPTNRYFPGIHDFYSDLSVVEMWTSDEKIQEAIRVLKMEQEKQKGNLK